MSDVLDYEFETKFPNNQIYANPKKLIIFDVCLKNKNKRNMAGYIAEYNSSLEFLKNKKRKGFGSVGYLEINNAIYKLKFEEEGRYIVEFNLLRRKEIINKLQVEFFVGVPLPQIKNTKKPIETKLNVPAADNNNFCSHCGIKMEESFQFCPNCGG